MKEMKATFNGLAKVFFPYGSPLVPREKKTFYLKLSVAML